jgi:hypothetical protein
MKRSLTIVASALFLAVVMPLACAASATPAVELTVDATDNVHKILRAHEVIPVAPGPLALYLPDWLPGAHRRAASAERVTGLKFRAAGKILDWVRDPVDPYRITLDIPAGAAALDIDIVFITPASSNGGRVFIDANITEVEWYGMTFYPVDRSPSDLIVHARRTTTTMPMR